MLPKGLDPCSRHPPPPPPLTLPVPPVRNWVTTLSCNLPNRDLSRSCPTVANEDRIQVARSLRVLPCSCLPHGSWTDQVFSHLDRSNSWAPPSPLLLLESFPSSPSRIQVAVAVLSAWLEGKRNMVGKGIQTLRSSVCRRRGVVLLVLVKVGICPSGW